jgi:hypothetical protein
MRTNGTRRLLVGIAVAFGALAPGGVSGQDVSGTWDVRWAQGVRVNRDGSVEIQRWGDAELVLSQQGDRVTGRWTTHIVETINWSVSGTLQSGRLRLEATEHDSENPELEMVELIEWDGTLDGDRIEGHVSLTFREMRREPGARPFTATRTPGG